MSADTQEKIAVSVVSGMDGVDRIFMQCEGRSDALLLNLSPSQARALANDLIAAVNRAEVKASIKAGPSLWRQTPQAAGPRLARAS